MTNFRGYWLCNCKYFLTGKSRNEKKLTLSPQLKPLTYTCLFWKAPAGLSSSSTPLGLFQPKCLQWEQPIMVQPLQGESSLWEVLKTQGIRVLITWPRLPFPQVEQMFQGPFLPGLFCDIVLSKHGTVRSYPSCFLLVWRRVSLHSSLPTVWQWVFCYCEYNQSKVNMKMAVVF